jgi:AraC-like DNA-binding protein
VAFVAFGPRAAGTLNGMALGPDRVMASPSGIEVEFVVEAGYESTSFLLPGDEFDAHFKSRARKHERFFLQDVQLLQTGLASARRFYSFGRRLTDLAARRPDLLENPETRSAAEGELFDTLFSTILSSAPSRTTAQDRTRQAYSQLVRVAQRHVLEHTAGPVRMLELCEATGVSERTLQNAFKQVLGMSPVTYLNRLRLHRARSALRAAAFGSTTVIDVALRWGFWHVSDFSQAYKRCFGELPSETLRRQEADRGISGRGNCSGRH